MLRAIGAQIEKTTNREACRDLSGRRLRDINEEKRLKAWIEKQADREEDAVERKKKKLERLCAEPKHEFKDKNYERERSGLTEKIDDAVEAGFKIAAASSSNLQEKIKIKAKQGVKRKTLFDDDIDSDELNSTSDDDSETESPKKKLANMANPAFSDINIPKDKIDSEENTASSDTNSEQSEDQQKNNKANKFTTDNEELPIINLQTQITAS